MAELGRHRYMLVLLLLLLDVLFAVLAPDGEASRLIGLGLLAIVLVVVIVTSGHRMAVRRRGVVAVLVAVLVVIAVGALGHAPLWLVDGLAGVLIVATIVELVRGMARLLKQDGVTVQALAGGIGIYLLLGMLFAVVIGVLGDAASTPYFAQGTDGSASQHVYFSFTTMTTVGYGDLSPATRPGRALAVFEMLLGQIYLVTVISLLVSRAQRRPDETH
jgi:hypothetical protein